MTDLAKLQAAMHDGDVPAVSAALRDKARERFEVYTNDGRTLVTSSRSDAATLAHTTNGTWARVPS